MVESDVEMNDIDNLQLPEKRVRVRFVDYGVKGHIGMFEIF